MAEAPVSPVSPNKMQQKLAKMQASVRMGGKGTMRRKKKSVHRSSPTDEKRLQSTIKKMGMTQIPGIEEVNMFKYDGNVINFPNPKVSALISANTFVISGSNKTKPLQEMPPSTLNQLGSDLINFKNIKELMEQLVANQGGEAGAAAGGEANEDDEDDDVPELVGDETFEDAKKTEDDTTNTAEAAEEEPSKTEEAGVEEASKTD